MLSSPVYAESHPRLLGSSSRFFKIPRARPLLSRQHPASVNPLSATLMKPPASVANKRLTEKLTPLDATLTKNRGVGATHRWISFAHLAFSGMPQCGGRSLRRQNAMHGGNRGNWLESAPEPFLGGSNRTFGPRRYRLSGQYVLGLLPAARNK
jgi:hypothetical protein